jgi:hypothetical protein
MQERVVGNVSSGESRERRERAQRPTPESRARFSLSPWPRFPGAYLSPGPRLPDSPEAAAWGRNWVCGLAGGRLSTRGTRSHFLLASALSLFRCDPSPFTFLPLPCLFPISAPLDPPRASDFSSAPRARVRSEKNIATRDLGSDDSLPPTI